MSRRIVAALATLAALLAVASPALADDPYRVTIASLDASRYPEMRATLSIVDAQGHPVRGVTASQVIVREDGDIRQSTLVAAATVTPVRVVLALDVSGSMAGKPIADAKAAIATLVRTLDRDDEVALVTFNSTVRTVQPPTTDKDKVIAAAQGVTASGDTAIYDAVATSADLLKQAPADSRRALVLLTDGVDTTSRTSRVEAARRISDGGFPVYVIGLGADADPATLHALADASKGGSVLAAASSAQLAGIYASLGDQLVTQYTLTYQSKAETADGTRIRLRLQVIRSGTLMAQVDSSYTAPPHAGAAPVASAPPSAAPSATTVLANAVPGVMPPEIVGLIGAASVITLLLWLAEVAKRWPGRQHRRLERFVSGLAVTAPEHSKRRTIVQRMVGPSLRSVGRPILRVTPSAFIEATRGKLQEAGEPMSLQPAEFIGIRFGAAMVSSILGIAVPLVGKADLSVAVAGAIPGALLGFTIPGLVLEAMVRSRKSALRRALPAALDMLALSVEAGLSFDGAVAQVAQRWDTPLSEEFRRLLLQFQIGRDRRQVLREVGLRTGLSEIGRFVNAVIQADSFGAPLSKVLQEQATEIRTRRRQLAEEQARKAPVKMLFPLVLLIFPALFVVILGPAVPRMLAIFGSFH